MGFQYFGFLDRRSTALEIKMDSAIEYSLSTDLRNVYPRLLGDIQVTLINEVVHHNQPITFLTFDHDMACAIRYAFSLEAEQES